MIKLFSVYWGYTKIAMGILASILLYYLMYKAIHYVLDPSKELAKRDAAIVVKTAETDYINSSIAKNKLKAEKDINAITYVDNNLTVTNWVW